MYKVASQLFWQLKEKGLVPLEKDTTLVNYLIEENFMISFMN